MKSNKYWEARANKRMYDYMESAEKASRKISKIYQQAASEIEEEIKYIFSSFSAGMSEAEAHRLLRETERIDYSALKQLYSKMKPGPEKDAVMKQLDAPAYRARITRLQALQKNLEKKCKEVYQAEIKQVTSCLEDLAKEAYYRTTFDLQQGTDIGYSFADINEKTVNQMLANKWSGEHYSKRIWGDTQRLASTLERELTVGFMTGKSIKKMSDVIMERFAVGSYEARRIMRTESNYIANQAEAESYKEAGIEKYRYVATLDNRTSETCQELDGKVFPVKEQKPGVNYPPMHPFCRSTTIAEFSPEIMAGLTRRARDPETGKTYTVPANMTYKEWKAGLESNGKGHMFKKSYLYTDRQQYERYKSILGAEISGKHLADFQKMKYTQPEKFKYIQLDYRRRNELIKHPERRLPVGEICVHESKFTRYLFNDENLQGIAKGRAFQSRLGYDLNNWKELQEDITSKSSVYPVRSKGRNEYGERFEQKIILYGKKELPANVVVGWLRKTDGSVNMTTAYIKEVD